MKWLLVLLSIVMLTANVATAAPPLTPTIGAHLDGWLDCIPHGDDDADDDTSDDDVADDDVEDDDLDDDADDDVDVILDQEGMFSYSYDTKETSLLFEFTNGQIIGFGGLPEGVSSTRLMELNPVVCIEDYDGPVRTCQNVASFATPLVFPLDESMNDGFVVIMELTSSSGDTMRYCWGDLPQHMSYNEYLGLVQYHSNKLMILPLDGWCPYGGCIRFVEGTPDIPNTFMQVKLAFHPADDTVLGFPAMIDVTRQQLIDGRARLTAENLNHEGFTIQQDKLVTGGGPADTFFVAVPAEQTNFILRLDITMSNGNAYGYADSGAFELPDQLAGCIYNIFSRDSGCSSFVVAQLDASTPYRTFLPGYGEVVEMKFVVPTTFPYGQVYPKSLTFELNTSPGVDLENFANPVLWFSQPDQDINGMFDYDTGLIGFNIANWGIQPGQSSKFGLKMYVYGLQPYSMFSASLIGVELADDYGNPVDIANLPIAGNWLEYGAKK